MTEKDLKTLAEGLIDSARRSVECGFYERALGELDRGVYVGLSSQDHRRIIEERMVIGDRLLSNGHEEGHQELIKKIKDERYSRSNVCERIQRIGQVTLPAYPRKG